MDRLANTCSYSEIDSFVEILHKQLYFAVVKGKGSIKLKSTLDTFFFSIDDELVYENFYCDFGPLNLSCIYKYCCKLNKYLQYAKGLKSVVHYTCSHPDKKANASCLIGSFCVIYLKFHPAEVWKIIQDLGPYKPFLDASQFPCGFTLKISDCLQAISKGLMFNFFDFDDFNIAEYDLHDKLQYGDMNWIVPRKFLAFIGPADNQTAHPPEFYIKYFLKNDIKTVIRLNSAIYDSAVAYNNSLQGLEHKRRYYFILMKFLFLKDNRWKYIKNRTLYITPINPDIMYIKSWLLHLKNSIQIKGFFDSPKIFNILPPEIRVITKYNNFISMWRSFYSSK